MRGIRKALPKQNGKKNHHASLPDAKVPDFIKELHVSEYTREPLRLMTEFTTLTAARSIEAHGARW